MRISISHYQNTLFKEKLIQMNLPKKSITWFWQIPQSTENRPDKNPAQPR